MNLTIELTAAEEVELEREARSHGLLLKDYAARKLRAHNGFGSFRTPSTPSGFGKTHAALAWLDSHVPQRPVNYTPEQLSRDQIYERDDG